MASNSQVNVSTQEEVRETKQELKEDGQELKEDGEELRETKQELKEDGQELKEDGQELKEDGEELRKAVQELREAVRELRKARQELKEDGLEVREAEEENVLRRLANIPLVSSTYNIAATAYNSTKDSHPYVTSLFNAAEKGVKTLLEMAFSAAQPILNKLEPRIAKYASKGLDTLEERFPILHLTAEQIADGTKVMVSTKVASAKEAVANTLSGVVDMTREAVVESKVGQIALSGAEAILESAEEFVDDYLPMTDEELAELAATVRNGGDLVAVRHSEQEEYLVRLGALSVKLRRRAYQHSLEKLKRARQRIQKSLSQLEQIIRLIEHLKNDAGQKLSEHQEKLREMVVEWSKSHTGTKDKAEVCACVQVDVQAIIMFQSMFQQLQTTCQMLMSTIQGFPSSLQEKLHQIRQTTKELHASLSSAGSLQELSNTLLAQSYQMVKKAQEYIEELWEYITFHTPLSWLVGPLTFSAKRAAEPGEQRGVITN